jgi:hypothetical protein
MVFAVYDRRKGETETGYVISAKVNEPVLMTASETEVFVKI